MWNLSVVDFAPLDALLLYRPSSLMSPGSADSCSAMDNLGSRGKGSVICVGKPPMVSSVPHHCMASLLSITPVTEMSENERQMPSRTVLLFVLAHSPLQSTVIPRRRLAGPCKDLSPEK